jgi:hypothetical protein
MGVALLYASYETGLAFALRKAASSKEKPPLSAVWLLDWIVYLGMALGSVSVFLRHSSTIAMVIFGSAVMVFTFTAIVVLRGGFVKDTVETLLGPPSRSKNPIKRIQMDIRKAAEGLLASAVLYFAIGGILVWLVWDSSSWYTVISISVLVTAFVRILEKSFDQYRAIVGKREALSALERLRLELFTNDEYDDEKLKKEFRQIVGLAEGEPSPRKSP